jgi:methyltransferase
MDARLRGHDEMEMTFNLITLAAVFLTALMRLGEIALGEINSRKMLNEGGQEFSPHQRYAIFAIYTLWLASLAFFTPPEALPNIFFLTIFAALELFRWWAIAHLGKFWTTRIVIVPLAFKITTGPYRFMRHPIYAVLIAEIMALSLGFGQLGVGCIFTGLTAWWVHFRMRAESRALQMML